MQLAQPSSPSQPPRPLFNHFHNGPAIRRDGALAHAIDPLEPHDPKDGAPHDPAGDGARRRQDEGDRVAAVEQDLEGLDIVKDDGPAEAARGRGHVVVPDDHQDRKQLGRARH